MAAAFDPTAFIEAERRVSQTLAPVASVSDDLASAWKPAENLTSEPVREPALATIAEIAETDLSDLPFDAAIREFIERDCPIGLRPERWDELTAETWDVHRNWARHAIGLGWTPLDLFGCNPDPYARRVDRDGLVACTAGLLSPVRLVEITPAHAVLACRTGPPMRHYRREKSGQVFLWDAYRMAGGP